MALQMAVVRDSRTKRVGRWLRDWIWATLDAPSRNLLNSSEEPTLLKDTNDDVLQKVYGRLSAELEAETERRRAVEAKLLAVGSVAPIAVTIMVAAVSFLSSGRLPDFVPVSVIIILGMGFYVALQFLRAMLAAIWGLSRMKYAVPRVSEVLPDGTEELSAYLHRASKDLVGRIEQHRETMNVKVDQLALAHKSMRNAVTALVIGLFGLLGVIVRESLR